MKRIFLVDIEGYTLDTILNYTDWEISVLIFPFWNKEKEEYKKNPRIKSIYTHNDFFQNRDLSGLDYSRLEKFEATQLKVENFFTRFFLDFQMGKFLYYCGFALAERLFKRYKPDMVLISGFPEGRTSDRLICDMAIQNQIPCYSFERMLYKTVLYDHLHKNFMQIKNNSVDIVDKLKVTVSFDLSYNTAAFRHPELQQNCFLRVLNKVIYKSFGQVGIDLAGTFYERSLRPDIFGQNFFYRIRKFIVTKYLAKYVDSLAGKFDKNAKYIYFSLHFEPESTISARTRMDNQIAALQMLSDALPEDWIIYVKEHPHQFLTNTRALYSYHVIDFKTKKFYKLIQKMDNVHFVSRRIDSKMLIDKSQAVASLSGTVTMEAVQKNKSVLVFAPQRTIYPYIHGIYCISSYDDCIWACKQLALGKKVVYDNANEVMAQYLFDFDKEGFYKALRVILNNER